MLGGSCDVCLHACMEAIALGLTKLCGAAEGGFATGVPALVEVGMKLAKNELPCGLGAGAGDGVGASSSWPSYVGCGDGDAFHAPLPLLGPLPRAPQPLDAIRRC